MKKNRFNTEYCFNCLRDLIEIDTMQPAGNEKNIVEKLCSYFRRSTEKNIIRHTEKRWSLVISFRGYEKESIVFVGHIDTVAYGNRNDWDTAPLVATRRGDKVYGRGTADMKGGVVAMLCAALTLEDMEVRPKKTVHFLFTADEEYSGLGARAAAECKDMKYVNEMIIAEPSDGKIGICEKGALWLRIVSYGKQAHAATPELGINAIEKLIVCYERLLEQVGQYGTAVYLGKGSVQVTKLCGGIMPNIVPAEAVMEVDIRFVPNLTITELLQDVQCVVNRVVSEYEGLAMDITVLNARSAVMTDEGCAFIRRVDFICDKIGIGKEKRGLHFYTDAAQLLSRYTIPFIIFGPGSDSIAHQVNEWVSLEDITQKAIFYWNYIKEYYLE